jgi:UDP-N-acetylmuramate--alanine ligase
VHLNVVGMHNVSNSLSVIVTCLELNIPLEYILQGVLEFDGAVRRFEYKGTFNGVDVIDDYAHHPTEIKVTLNAARQKYPDKRLVVVFRPNTFSRTVDFTDEFVEAFNMADVSYLTEIDSNREKQEDYPGVTSHMIIDKLNNGDIISEETIDKLKDEKDSVVCFMGCAYVDSLINAFKEIMK